MIRVKDAGGRVSGSGVEQQVKEGAPLEINRVD